MTEFAITATTCAWGCRPKCEPDGYHCSRNGTFQIIISRLSLSQYYYIVVISNSFTEFLVNRISVTLNLSP